MRGGFVVFVLLVSAVLARNWLNVPSSPDGIVRVSGNVSSARNDKTCECPKYDCSWGIYSNYRDQLSCFCWCWKNLKYYQPGSYSCEWGGYVPGYSTGLCRLCGTKDGSTYPNNILLIGACGAINNDCDYDYWGSEQGCNSWCDDYANRNFVDKTGHCRFVQHQTVMPTHAGVCHTCGNINPCEWGAPNNCCCS